LSCQLPVDASLKKMWRRSIVVRRGGCNLVHRLPPCGPAGLGSSRDQSLRLRHARLEQRRRARRSAFPAPQV